jgi:riboflavin transporter FmnP
VQNLETAGLFVLAFWLVVKNTDSRKYYVNSTVLCTVFLCPKSFLDNNVEFIE